jgi:hypothetical protein
MSKYTAPPNYKGYYYSHFGLPLGQALDTPRTSVSHVPEARARSI